MKKEYYLYLLLSSTVLGVPVVYAACVPTPDCEELGYTSTICPQGGVKCPWDTTKLFCGCDGMYKYKCIGRGYAGGNGQNCDDKYTSCKCGNRYKWEDGSCVLDCSVTECKIGSILYSDKTCSYCRLESKTPIGVIGGTYNNTKYVVGLNEIYGFWLIYEGENSVVDIPGIENTLDMAILSQAYNGYSNTKAWIDTIRNIYSSEKMNEMVFAKCNDYVTSNTSNGDWFLPSAAELYMVAYTNIEDVNDALLVAGGTPITEGQYYWSSSEADRTNAWYVHAGRNYGTVRHVYKVINTPARCLTTF